MAGLAGILTGAIALAALETIVANDNASTGFASFVQVPGQWARTFMDPTKPLLPNYAKAACAEGGDVNVLNLMASYTTTAPDPAMAQQIPNYNAAPASPLTTPPPTTIQA